MHTSLSCLGIVAFQPHFNVADLSPYLEDDYLTDLRSNSIQQGKDDGAPSIQPNLDLHVYQGSLTLPAKVQGMTQVLIGSKSKGPRFESKQKPSFVYVIS